MASTANRCVLTHFSYLYLTLYSFFAFFPCSKKNGGWTDEPMDRPTDRLTDEWMDIPSYRDVSDSLPDSHPLIEMSQIPTEATEFPHSVEVVRAFHLQYCLRIFAQTVFRNYGQRGFDDCRAWF